MSERTAYKIFRDNVRQRGDRIDRIENMIGVGNFDINCCFEGTEMWIELKSPIEPKREKTRLFGSNHKLSQDQKNWALRQLNAGGLCWVMIATDVRWMIIHGRFADHVNELTVAELMACADYTAIKRELNWKALRQALRSRQPRWNTSSRS